MIITSFDPGGTTGAVLLDSTKPTEFRSYQFEQENHFVALWSFLHANQPDKIVAEDFDYRVMTDNDRTHNRKGIELISRDYLGIIKLYHQLYMGYDPDRLIIQKPAYAVSKDNKKEFFNNDKLERMDIYVKGAPHANDGMRHLLMYLVFKLKVKKYLEYLKPLADRPKQPLVVHYTSV